MKCIKKSQFLLIITLLTSFLAYGQTHNFRIRTITAGVSLSNLSDTTTISNAIAFLKNSKAEYVGKGYEVQTLRIVTQNVYEYLNGKSYQQAIPYLKVIDQIAVREGIQLSIGELLPPNQYKSDISDWVVMLIKETDNINFSLPISSTSLGVHSNSIKAAAEITIAISKNSPERGKGISDLLHLQIVRLNHLSFRLRTIKEREALL